MGQTIRSGFSKGITRASLFDAQAERLIAQGRVLLCALVVVVVLIEIAPLSQRTIISYLPLLFYCFFAATVLALTNSSGTSSVTTQLVHAADIAFLSILLVSTESPTNPFFVFFVFVLSAASLRWNWQGVIVTLALLSLIYLVASSVPWTIPGWPGVGDQFGTKTIIRAGYLVVAGGMLAFVTALPERDRDRMQRLANWPGPDVSNERMPSIATALAHAANVLGAPRALVLWEEIDEPYVNVALWHSGTYQTTRRLAGTFDNLVHPALSNAAFVTEDASKQLIIRNTSPLRITGCINEQLRREFQILGMASAPFLGTKCKGRVFILDRHAWNHADLLLTEIIASRVGIELDRAMLQNGNEEAAAARERLRVARDIHDGVLQSLTAATLQLKLAGGNAVRDIPARLAAIAQLLAREQQRIREFVQAHKPNLVSTDIRLSDALQTSLSEIAQQWNCTATLALRPQDVSVPRPLAAQLSLMLAEAVANAARHGGASKVDVNIETAQDRLLVNIRDNGRGFHNPSLADPAGTASVLEPRSLYERVAELGGVLNVSSSPSGVDLEIRVPL